MQHGRQMQFERLQFFSDAVFAIAITLLVIEVRVPHMAVPTDAGLRTGLLALIPNYISFLISFFVIGRFWMGHHRLFGYLADWDAGLVRINLLFLFTIAFMPFPTAVIGEYPGAQTAQVFYAGWLILAGICNLLLVRYTLRREALLVAPLTPLQRHDLRSSWLPIAIGTAAIVASNFQPITAIIVLTISPFVLPLLLALWARRYR